MGGCKESKQGHDQHLCKLVKCDDFEQVRKLVKDAAFICKKCGRAARDKDNLCDPSRI